MQSVQNDQVAMTATFYKLKKWEEEENSIKIVRVWTN
jgi:hypothetical protein